jgi:hypothetical protein
MNNIVIEIPSIKKEVLRVAAYCRISTAYEEQQTCLDSQIRIIIQITSTIMRAGYLQISIRALKQNRIQPYDERLLLRKCKLRLFNSCWIKNLILQLWVLLIMSVKMPDG